MTSDSTPVGAGAAAKLWGGRFRSGPSAEMAALSRSVDFDWRLAPYDLVQSQAHARVLHSAGLLNDGELAQMLQGLQELADDVAAGIFRANTDDEDVHTALERGLVERLGAELGGKLRAGRSRNDQVATDFRLYLREQSGRIEDHVVAFVDLGVALVNEMRGCPFNNRTAAQIGFPVAVRKAVGRWQRVFSRDVDLGLGQHADRERVRFRKRVITR